MYERTITHRMHNILIYLIYRRHMKKFSALFKT